MTKRAQVTIKVHHHLQVKTVRYSTSAVDDSKTHCNLNLVYERRLVKVSWRVSGIFIKLIS